MADREQPPWRDSITAIEVHAARVERKTRHLAGEMCKRVQPTRWLVFSAAPVLVLLALVAAVLALLDDRAFVVVHLLSKSWFGAFLYGRARLLYRKMRRSLGAAGAVNVVAVGVMFALSVAALARHDYRRLVFVGGGESGSRTSSYLAAPLRSREARRYVEGKGLELRSLAASCIVLADILVLALAQNLYAAPLKDAVRLASSAGMRDETAAYRAALKRHYALCALAVCSTCWVWCALVFFLIPVVVLLCFLFWWQYALWRTRTDALTALAALLSPSRPGAQAPPGRRWAKVAKIVALVVFGGVLAPLGVLALARGRTLRGRAAFVVADMWAHGALCHAFLRTSSSSRSGTSAAPPSPTALAGPPSDPPAAV